MKRKRVFFGLLSVAVLAATTAPPAVAAAACQVQDLPLPEGADGGRTRGTSDNGLIVGNVFKHGFRGVVWENASVRQMAEPALPSYTRVLPSDINNGGTVAGAQVINLNGPESERAFVYRDGVYYLLYTEEAEQSRWVTLWPANQPRRMYAKGEAVGISADRKLVLVTDPNTISAKVWVIDGDTGRWTALPGARGPGA